jgi:hypothetical protein
MTRYVLDTGSAGDYFAHNDLTAVPGLPVENCSVP